MHDSNVLVLVLILTVLDKNARLRSLYLETFRPSVTVVNSELPGSTELIVYDGSYQMLLRRANYQKFEAADLDHCILH